MTIKPVTLKMTVTRIKRIGNIPDKINLLQKKIQSFSSHEEAAKSFVLILKIKRRRIKCGAYFQYA
jgi:hypothetical protein